MAESKMPNVTEWAKRFVTSGYSLGVEEVIPLLLAFRREDLLAVLRECIRQGYGLGVPADIVRRLAEEK